MTTKKCILFFIFFYFLLSTFYFLPLTVLAVNEFSSSYDVNYEVKENGITTVTQNVHLTNLTTNYYPSEYTLSFSTEKISRVSARDSTGPLKVEVTQDKDLTKIHLVFNDKVVGQGKTLNWTLSFESTEIGKKIGRVWEINIPKVASQEQPTSYNVTLTVPAFLGQPAYVWPKPVQPWFWTLPESKRGITLAFGDWQGFSFKLSYHLENREVIPGETSIALPPDTLYQKIIFNQITPEPREITIDEDGNWLAKYYLLPKQKQEIKVSGFAQVFLEPQESYLKANKGLIHTKYLRPQKFWETDDQTIRDLAKKLKTPQAIYEYVVATLNYDYERARQEPIRLGASQALVNPNKAICMEFTDLFIALSRAAGIPAREVDGFAYTSNSRLRPLSLVTDVLHSWPQYWDEKKSTWIQVDPTWEKTSQLDYFNRFDFNHLALAIRGISSTEPYPAGSYKPRIPPRLERGSSDGLVAGRSPAFKIEESGKDVLIDFQQDLPTSLIKSLEISLTFPKWIIAGIPFTGQLKITNNNKEALYHQKVSLTSFPLQPSKSELYFPILAPLTQKKVDVRIENSNPFLYNPLQFSSNILTVWTGTQRIASTETKIVSLPLVFIVLTVILLFFLSVFIVARVVRKT